MSSDNYTVCVIGASGFLGSHIVKQALEKGWKVNGVFRDATDESKKAWLYKLPNAKDNLTLFSGDLCKPGSFSPAVTGCDGAIMAALPESPSCPELIETVRGGVDHFLKSCLEAKVKSVVVTSSGGSTNPKEGEPDVKNELEHWSDPEYQISQGKFSAAAKTLMDKSALKFGEDHLEMKVVILNPNLIMGPVLSTDFPTSGSLPTLLRILKGEVMATVANGSMSIIDVRDLAALELAALRKEDATGRYFGVLRSFHWIEILETLHAVRPSYSVPEKGYAADVKEARPTQFDHTRKESLGVELRDLKVILGDAVQHLVERGLLQ